ncbi:hypothetical protein [Haloarchaeobius sp. DYHT-AS-18]|uniref:hypothetical protein n=1 Tax=Haloarchaeobius sp. DYHT-AS-18 TaxID=3446117 RepID=UPI003EBD2C30
MRPAVTDLDTGQGPPTAIPLRHFLVALAFLAAGMGLWVIRLYPTPQRVAPPPAVVHAVVVGWICLTIMGAMTQFVPVWSGVRLHSTRLARLQLPLVAGGVVGIVAGFWSMTLWLVPAGGLLAGLGLWLFTYNIWRTLPPRGDRDVTETHFAVALAFLSAVPAVGLALGAGFLDPAVLDSLPPRDRLVSAHATMAVFGVILPTVFGALYQLAVMFAGTSLDERDQRFQRVETAVYPLGVGVLAAGRLLDSSPVARLGGALVLVGVAAFTVVLGRVLRRRTVETTPTLARYGVVAVALACWVVLTVPAWVGGDPTAATARYGGTGGVALLLFGGVAVVVVGSLYHVIPFLVWLERYSDLLGYEPVPMVEDLFDHRLARADFWLVVAGTGLVAGADLRWVPGTVFTGGVVLLLTGFLLVAANMGLVVHRDAGQPDRGAVDAD